MIAKLGHGLHGDNLRETIYSGLTASAMALPPALASALSLAPWRGVRWDRRELPAVLSRTTPRMRPSVRAELPTGGAVEKDARSAAVHMDKTPRLGRMHA